MPRSATSVCRVLLVGLPPDDPDLHYAVVHARSPMAAVSRSTAERSQENNYETGRADTTTSEQDSEDNAVDGCASSSQCRSKAKAKPRSSPMPKTSPKGKAKPKAARAQPKNSVASRGIAARRPTQTEEDAYVTPDDEEELGCPICGAPMTFRRANAGGCFRGCTRFPTCRGTRRPFDP